MNSASHPLPKRPSCDAGRTARPSRRSLHRLSRTRYTAMLTVCPGIAISRPSTASVVALPLRWRPWPTMYVKMTETIGILARDIIQERFKHAAPAAVCGSGKRPFLIHYGALVISACDHGGTVGRRCATSVHRIESDGRHGARKCAGRDS